MRCLACLPFVIKLRYTFEPDALAFIIHEKQEPNLMQMLQSLLEDNINGEIELYSSKSLQIPGFMALALIALEKQS